MNGINVELSHRDTIEAYVQYFNTGRRTDWLDLFCETLHHEDPVGSRIRTTRSELELFWDGVFAAVVSIEIKPNLVLVEGNDAVMIGSILSHQHSRTDQLSFVDHFDFDQDHRIRSLRGWFVVIERQHVDQDI